MTDREKERPGSVVMNLGLAIAAAGLVLTLVLTMTGGTAAPLWLILGGLVIAAIGFAQRILAALEGQRSPSND